MQERKISREMKRAGYNGSNFNQQNKTESISQAAVTSRIAMQLYLKQIGKEGNIQWNDRIPCGHATTQMSLVKTPKLFSGWLIFLQASSKAKVHRPLGQ